MRVGLPVHKNSAVFASLDVHILNTYVRPPEKQKVPIREQLEHYFVDASSLLLQGHNSPLIWIIDAFQWSQTKPYCLSVHTLPSIMNDCTKVLFKAVLFLFFSCI